MAAAVLSGTRGSAGQVVLDGTLGPKGPRIGPDYVISPSLGRQAGRNLFHSFSQFNVRKGESATFTGGALPIDRVFARVTGRSASRINGLLRNSIPGADLYLINPSGVILGANATLDVGGSFVISTLQEVQFKDGGVFGPARQSEPVLSAAAPVAFGFIGGKPAGVTFVGGDESTRLQVPLGESLSVFGGAIEVRQRILQSLGGQVRLVSAVEEGSYALESTGVESARMGPIRLRDGATLSAPVGGTVVVRGGDLKIDSSTVIADTDALPGGGVDIALTGKLDVRRGLITSRTFGDARAGDIRIQAEDVRLEGLSSEGGREAITVTTLGPGRGGNVMVETGELRVLKDGAISAFAERSGDSGSITVNARRRVLLDGTGRFRVTGLVAETLGQVDGGDSGDITVRAPRIDIRNNAEVTSTTTGSGDAGNIRMFADRSFTIDGGDLPLLTGLQARVGRGRSDQGASGRGGVIKVRASRVHLLRGGVLSASTLGQSPGGDVIVKADEIEIEGTGRSEFTGIFARSARQNEAADGGTIRIDTGTLRISGEGGAIAAESIGDADAGDVFVRARRFVELMDGGAINTRADERNAGNITIRAGEAIRLGESREELPDPIVAVDLDAAPRHSRITAEALNGGEGNIQLRTRGTLSLLRSLITAEALDARGGQIGIDAQFVVLNDSVINGRSAGQPVQVTIASDALLFQSLRSAILTAQAVVPPPVDIAGSLAPLGESVLATDAGLLEACAIQYDGVVSTFLVQGRGGARPSPGGWVGHGERIRE